MAKKKGASHQAQHTKNKSRNHKHKQHMQKYTIGAVLLVMAVAALLFSPVFAIQNIRAEKAIHFTTSELCEKMELSWKNKNNKTLNKNARKLYIDNFTKKVFEKNIMLYTRELLNEQKNSDRKGM